MVTYEKSRQTPIQPYKANMIQPTPAVPSPSIMPSSEYHSFSGQWLYSWIEKPTWVTALAVVTIVMYANRLVAITLLISAVALFGSALIIGVLILGSPFWWLLVLPTLGPITSGLLSLYFVAKKR